MLLIALGGMKWVGMMLQLDIDFNLYAFLEAIKYNFLGQIRCTIVSPVGSGLYFSLFD